MKSELHNILKLNEKSLCRIVCEQGEVQVFIEGEKLKLTAGGFVLLDKNKLMDLQICKKGFESRRVSFYTKQDLSFVYLDLKPSCHLRLV